MPAAQHAARPIRSSSGQDALTPPPWTGGAGPACGSTRLPSDPRSVLLQRLLRGPAGQRQEHRRHEQDRRERVQRLPERLHRQAVGVVDDRRRERSRRLEEEREAVDRVRARSRPSPDTIESMIASPSARAVASTAAAMIAGRTARTEIVHITRQRLTPSAAAPSVHERGTERSASTMIAIMIGVIITVRISDRDDQAGAGQLHDVDAPTPCAPALIRWLPTNGTITSTPISP